MTITIAHLSDVHLGPISGFTPRYWNAKRALGYINWRRKRRAMFRRDVLDLLVADMQAQDPDHIAVTGDLINIGLPREMEAAAGWLDVVGPPDRVSVIPGNHDIYTSMRGDPGIARWAAYMRGDDQIDPMQSFPYVRRVGDVALIGLNSGRETPPFVAVGELGTPQRARLSTILDDLRRAALFRLVMIHHPPLPGQASPAKALQDARELQDVLIRHGAELVIHGHNHRAMLGRVAVSGTPVVGVPAAAMSVPRPNEALARYNLYRITSRRSGGRRDKWSVHMISRGLREPGGPICEIDDVLLTSDMP